MTIINNAFCSSCYQQSNHQIREQNYLRRNVYLCNQCQEATLTCLAVGCTHMTRAGKNWDEKFCAEHDGSIASFAKLNVKLANLADYKSIFERDSLNLVRATKIGAGTIAGVAVFAPLAVLAGPGIAAALGGTGLLGAAGTGTAISSLSGAALTSASLAAIGGGTMAAGTIVLTATGAALGAYQGGVISNSYFGAVDHFDIRRIQYGNKHAVIVVNGFLTEGKDDVSDWIDHLVSHFPRNTWYHTDWESKNLHKLGALISKAPKVAGVEIAKEIAKRAAKAAPKKIGPFAMASHISDLVANPWHVSMVKAQLTGIMLADAIARTPGWRFTLAGHSLGARVIYYALEALSTKSKTSIESVYLLGGAVGGGKKDNQGWEKALKSVKGKLYNCYSKNDDVLKFMYQGFNGYSSEPIGYSEIQLDHDKKFDFDCTALVSGHGEWKPNFGEILTQLKALGI
jgi:hypothetical protein